MRCEIGCRVKWSFSDRREDNESVTIKKFPMGFYWMRAIRHWFMAVSSVLETEAKSGRRYDWMVEFIENEHDVLFILYRGGIR